MKDLYAYMGSIIKDNQSIPIIINGTEDHVHLLFVMSKNNSLADLTEEIKKHSSRWIKTRGPHYKSFAWQGGYAGFSVSQSIHEITKKYIANQKEHHKKTLSREELIAFLKKYGVKYDDNYLWTD
jgi:REP element-mobilizing transposase RayT